MTERVVVVGGGITGLAAAHEARRQGLDVVVLEAAPRAGGKIDSGFVEGAALPFPVDMAADGFLARQPEVVQLCHEIGLGDDLVSPTGAQAFIWANGALRAIPSPSVLGVPFDPASVAASGIVSDAGVADLEARIDLEHEPLVGDASVGEVLRPRVGDEIFDRLVDPLLGGINAGYADGLSIEAGAPQLFAAAKAGGSLRTVLRAQVDAAQATAAGPVFNGVVGGNRRIVDTLVEQLGPRVRVGERVVGLDRDGASWVVATETDRLPADRVVLATPGWVSAGLLAPHTPTAAATLADLAYGDAVLVTFVVDRAGLDHDLAGSGFLVPRSEGLLMTACSWASSKWHHYDDGRHAILRVSAGRTDDRRWVDLDPTQLLGQLGDELAETIGLHAEPVARITPWRRSLPQYRPGHFARCDEIDAELALVAEGLVVTGAQMRGLGLPACVRQGRASIT
ncbi:MAG: protoporphyrinogen oxidase [Actinomycetota bacterium]